MKINFTNGTWINEPEIHSETETTLMMRSEPHTDLWQRTYYHFRNDNAPMMEWESDEEYFTFGVKCDFDTHHRYEQPGIVLYLDSDNWIKASIEYENESFAHVGAVVTNNGFSDWSSAEIATSARIVYYRLSRRGMDFKVEYSLDGVRYSQMRICHMHNAGRSVRFGIYACSPEESSFEAKFSELQFGECVWAAHDGQQPDADIDY